jgi:periplasmic divalent cation tolerance protein
MNPSYAILVTTIDSDDKARELIEAALEARLAACAQVFPIRSHYVWKGELREEAELFIQMKLRAQDYAPLAALIKRLHGYETPEILRLDVADGDPAYLDWITEATRRD